MCLSDVIGESLSPVMGTISNLETETSINMLIYRCLCFGGSIAWVIAKLTENEEAHLKSFRSRPLV